MGSNLLHVPHFVASSYQSMSSWRMAEPWSTGQARQVHSQLLLMTCGPSPVPSGTQRDAGPQGWGWVLTLTAGSIHRPGGAPHLRGHCSEAYSPLSNLPWLITTSSRLLVPMATGRRPGGRASLRLRKTLDLAFSQRPLECWQ